MSIEPTRKTSWPRRRSTPWLAAIGSLSVVVTIAVVAQGYDAQETPRVDPHIWVTKETGDYARVNSETWELDVVRHVDQPSSVIQAGSTAAILSDGNARAWPVDPANPQDFANDSQDDPADEVPGEIRMPDGTRDVVNNDSHIVVRTKDHNVLVANLHAHDDSQGQPIDEFITVDVFPPNKKTKKTLGKIPHLKYQQYRLITRTVS